MVSCAEAKTLMIDNVTLGASKEIGFIVDTSSALLGTLVANAVNGGICPLDLNILLNGIVKQTNAQIEQIVVNAINNTSIIPNLECCS